MNVRVLWDLNGNLFSSPILSHTSRNQQDYTLNYSVFLCPGIYHIVGDAIEMYAANPPSDSHNSYHWTCTNANFANYRSLNTTDDCTSTMSIAGDLTMLNPVFKLPAEKKMVFSAWVRESNSQVTTYNNNEVQIDFDGGNNVTLTPTGPIIEGWQRMKDISMFQQVSLK